MSDSMEELVAVRKLLQEAIARAEKAERERDNAVRQLLVLDIAREPMRLLAERDAALRELEDARRELARLRAHQEVTTGGL